jgi:hypothetical protein
MRKIALAHLFFDQQSRQTRTDHFVSRLRAIAFGIFAIGLAIAATPQRASAQFPPCGAVIEKCGCAIAGPGLFSVSAPSLTTTGAASCIKIHGKNIALNLAGTPITGPANGSSLGSGVEIQKGSSNVFVEGNGATISGFEFGIENDGADVTIEDLTVQTNDDAGVHFSRAKNGAISLLTAQTNGGYGIWLEGSAQNNIGGNTQVTSNVLDGILIGCAPVVGTGTCKGIGAGSDQNTIFNVTATNNGTGNPQSGGVTIQFNSKNNSIGRSSGSGNAKADFLNRHAAGACGNNLFFSDVGTTGATCF